MGLALEILHLCAFAQVGVLVRFYLGRLFGGACSATSRSWPPCVTSPGLTRWGGALFIDLPSNVAGSFVMGLLSPSDIVAAATGEPSLLSPFIPCPLLPACSLQHHKPLLVGLRTGFCGSLTTFASWMLQVTAMFVGGFPESLPDRQDDVVSALWALLIGWIMSVGALVAGQHVALYVYSRRMYRNERAVTRRQDISQGGGFALKAGAVSSLNSEQAGTRRKAEVEMPQQQGGDRDSRLKAGAISSLGSSAVQQQVSGTEGDDQGAEPSCTRGVAAAYGVVQQWSKDEGVEQGPDPSVQAVDTLQVVADTPDPSTVLVAVQPDAVVLPVLPAEAVRGPQGSTQRLLPVAGGDLVTKGGGSEVLGAAGVQQEQGQGKQQEVIVGVQPELEECRDGGAQIQGQHQLNGHAQQIPNASIADREGSQIAAGVASTAIQVSSQSPHTAGGPATQQSPSVAHLHSQHHSPARPASVWAADAAALCILLLLTGLSIGYGVVWAREDVYINSQPGTVLWYGMLVGPFGCLLRWHLAGFNARPAPGTASSGTTWWERKEQLLFPVWLPLGTLLANQIACLVDFAMQSIIVRVGDTRTHVQLSMAVAAVLGFSGCLSTVSTWVVELQKLALQRPEGYGRWLGIQRSLIYGLVSVTLAVAFGCIVYGTAVWTW